MRWMPLRIRQLRAAAARGGRTTRTPHRAFVFLGLAGGVFVAACSTMSALTPVEPPPRSAFDSAAVAKGAQLAAIGNCVTCHTARGGRAYAGGFPLETPFGTVYGTNITPDPETGIGRWSEAAFARAMREGIDR